MGNGIIVKIVGNKKIYTLISSIRNFLIFGDGLNKPLHPKDISSYYGITDS